MKTRAQEKLARAHYDDPWLYDHRYKRRSLDIDHYLTIAKKAGRVLELGAGTGRITLPLARAGVEVVALEREASLCDRLRERLKKEGPAVQGKVRIVRGDFRVAAKLSERFECTLAPFNAFSHVYDERALIEVLRVMRKVTRQLAFDVPLPSPETLAYDPDRRYRIGGATGKDGQKYAYYESFDYDAAAQTLLILAHYDAFDPTGRSSPDHRASFVLPLLHRMHFPRELALIVAASGFRIVKHEGGFAGEALSRDSDSQVLVCR